MFVAWGEDLLTFYNDAYAPILEGKSNTLGSPFREVFPEAWDLLEPLFSEALAGESCFFDQFHATIERGGKLQETWWTFSFSPIVDEAGRVYGVFAPVHEITARIVAEQRLRESQALFTGFSHNSSDMLWTADVESRELEYLSPAFYAIWGTPPPGTALTWDYWLSTVHPDDRGQQLQSLDRLLAGEVLREEYRIIRTDGAIRWLRDTMFPIVDPDGVIRKVGGIAEDITRENRMIVHLIDPVLETRNMLSQRLQAIGYQVRAFGEIDPFLRVSRALLPGCVLLHDHGDCTSAVKLASALKTQLQSLPMVLLCNVCNPAEVVDLMKQGVSDIIFRGDTEDRLDSAVATALATMQSGMRESDAVRDARDKVRALTDREREILQGLSGGATNKMIGRDLGLSPRTVETYRFRILERLGVSTLPEAIKLAAIAGL